VEYLNGLVVSIAACGSKGREFDASLCSCVRLEQLTTVIAVTKRFRQTDYSLWCLLPRPTQPSILPGSVNEDQLWPGRQRQVWFIPFLDKPVGVQVELRNLLTTRAIPERSCNKVSSLRDGISSA